MAYAEGWFAVALIIVVVLLVLKVVNKKQAAAVKLTIILFVFLMISAGYVVISKGADLSSFEGMKEAARVYFSWLGAIFTNLFKVTNYAVKQDWSIETAANINSSAT